MLPPVALLALALAVAPPAESPRPLADGPLVVELAGRAVDVTFAPRATATYRVVGPRGEPWGEEATAGAIVRTEEGATTRLAAREDAPAAAWRLELRLPSGALLRVDGADLDVAVRDLAPAPPTPAFAADAERGAAADAARLGPGDRHPLEIVVAGSRVDLRGVADALVDGVDTAVVTAGSRGTLTLLLERGRGEVEGHRGRLHLEGSGADVAVAGSRGEVEVDLSGGTLTVADAGGARLAGRLADTLAVVAGWDGAMDVEQAGGRLELRGAAPGRPRPLAVRGERGDLVVDGWPGPVELDLRGGSARVGDVGGALRLTASEGAEAAVAGVAGAVDVHLSDAATARVAGAARVGAEVVGASLAVDGAGALRLAARDAVIALAGVTRLQGVDVTGGELDADLAGVEGEPRLALADGARARVRLPAPCRVQVLGHDVLDRGVVVTGCEQVAHEGRRRSPARGLDGRRATFLVVQVAGDVELDVEASYR